MTLELVISIPMNMFPVMKCSADCLKLQSIWNRMHVQWSGHTPKANGARIQQHGKCSATTGTADLLYSPPLKVDVVATIQHFNKTALIVSDEDLDTTRAAFLEQPCFIFSK